MELSDKKISVQEGERRGWHPTYDVLVAIGLWRWVGDGWIFEPVKSGT